MGAMCLVEFIGTFYLVFTVAMAATSGSALAPLSIGASLMCMVFMGGPISGGHFNPAVSLGVFLRTRKANDPFRALQLATYFLAQLVGGFAACFTSQWILTESWRWLSQLLILTPKFRRTCCR